MALQEVGVEAVVRGLSAFQGDIRAMNNSLQSLRGEGTFLQQMFGAVSDGILGFGEHIVRVAEVALGVLLRDAIRAVVDAVKELIGATLEAGAEFQTLEIRLERLNFNSLIEGGMDYNEAAAKAVELTKEQLAWLQKLAAESPYDSKDVANVFTLARSYGFTAEEAQNLTGEILDFAAGMGLGNTEIQRIIVNFGQMVQQGKVTQRELNDLARGSFVPVNDILKIMQERTGLAGNEFDKFRNSTAGVEMFMSAFAELVEKRFAGATEKMARTFQGATANVMDLVKGIFGLNTVKPVLDVLGEKVASFASAFTQDPKTWDRLVDAAGRLGEAISSVVSGILELLPGTENLTDMVIGLVENAATWVEDNRENIIGFFKGIGDTIQNEVVPFIRDNLIPAIVEFFTWIADHKEEIMQFFKDLATTIIEDVVPFVRDYLIPAFQKFSDWVLENKDLILSLFDRLGDAVLQLADFILPKLESAMAWIEENPEKVEGMINAWGKWQYIGTILNVVGGVIISIGGFIAALAAGLSGLIGILQILGSVISGTVLAVLGGLWATIGIVRAEIRLFQNSLELWKDTFDRVANWAAEFVNNIQSAFQDRDWSAIGLAIVQGIADGMSMGNETFMDAAERLMGDLWDSFSQFWELGSPSKRSFRAGINIMQGMALGVQKAAGVAAVSMQAAMARVSSSAMPSMTSSTIYNNTQNNTLNIHSSAPTEPIMQDFAMMSSLAGV